MPRPIALLTRAVAALGLLAALLLLAAPANAELVALDVEPELGDDDWAGAAVALADDLQPSELPWAGIGIGAGVLALGGGGWFVVTRRRDAAEEAERIRAAGPYPDESTEQLTGRASEGLLAVDEAVRTSQRHCGT